MRFELRKLNPSPNAAKEELASVILGRIGLLPKKVDAKAGFNKLLLELYEKKKLSVKENKPELSLMTIEEMALISGIKRQTFYDHLGRWIDLGLIKKATYIKEKDRIRGYELAGNNVENAFNKVQSTITEHLEQTREMISLLQNEIKKEKLRKGNEE